MILFLAGFQSADPEIAVILFFGFVTEKEEICVD